MAVVYGTSYIEATRQFLYARLGELVTAMATGYDPTFTEVHDTHTVADIQLSAITIGLERAEAADGADAIGTTGIVANHRMIYTIRVHTDFAGGLHDEKRQARLLESIENKLRARLTLASATQPRSQIQVWQVGQAMTKQIFEESATIGGALVIEVRAVVEHTQE
jgi:hypothetical protein